MWRVCVCIRKPFDNGWMDGNVCTVELYNGTEKDLVCLSLCTNDMMILPLSGYCCLGHLNSASALWKHAHDFS